MLSGIIDEITLFHNECRHVCLKRERKRDISSDVLVWTGGMFLYMKRPSCVKNRSINVPFRDTTLSFYDVYPVLSRSKGKQNIETERTIESRARRHLLISQMELRCSTQMGKENTVSLLEDKHPRNLILKSDLFLCPCLFDFVRLNHSAYEVCSWM